MNGLFSKRVAARALVAGLLVAPSPGSAGEDGGTQSVFSQPPGYRALGMGAAYVAVTNDATATSWNPGGLARVSRLEVQAGQTRYFGLGVSESYLAFAVPNWRWGAAAASLRHFGVSGIERRDDRNVLLEEDLSDSQTEIAFGYGRSIHEAWSIGTTVKLRRQSLAGLSANGYGLDFGVTALPGVALGLTSPWARDLTWGLSLGNLIAPSLRLDRESVPDPRAVRTGVAYVHPLFGYRALIAALDVEKVANSSARLHAGMEFRLHPLLALRAGLSGGTMTAGTGLQWRDLALDYVYEENPIEGIHRVGLSYAFGPTVAESREAAILAEEEATQARLAEAFQKRQEEQVASLLASAEEHRGQGRFDDALDLLATITALEPGHARARTLEALCLVEKASRLEKAGSFADAAVVFGRALSIDPADTAAAAGQERCQAESNRRAARSAELRKAFAAALDAFGADRLVEAREGFQRILAAEPDDGDAADMLRRTHEAIVRRTASLLKQADRYVQGKLFAEAATLIEQVTALDPRAAGLAQASAALDRAKQREAESRRGASQVAKAPAGAPAPSRNVPAPLTEKERKEIELLYRRGLDAMKERRSDDALRYLELVWSADPGHQNVVEYLKREYLMRGMESFAAGRLDEAVGFWERALKVDPTDTRAKGYLTRAQQQLARTREILGDGP